MSQGLPQLDSQFYIPQIVWFAISFLILWLALQFWIVPKYRAIQKARQDALRDLMDTLRAQKEALQDLRAQSQRLDQEARAHLAALTQEAQNHRKEALAKAQEAARDGYERHLKEVQDALAGHWSASLEALKQEVPALSALILRHGLSSQSVDTQDPQATPVHTQAAKK